MVEPATAYDAKGLIKAAIRDDDPVLFFEHKFLYRRIKEEMPAEDYIVPIGKAAVRREGRDLSIITFGAMVHTALEAAETLETDGVEVEVLDLRSLAPLDHDAILTSVAKTSRALLLHEATLTGGIGGELAAIIAEDGVRVPRRAGHAAGLGGHAGALLAAARSGVSAERGTSGRCGETIGPILNRAGLRRTGVDMSA